MRFITVTFFFALFSFTGCEQKGTTDLQFRQYFQLSDFGSITTDSVRAALLKKFPVGTSAKEITTIIEQNGFNQDKLNQYSRSDNGVIFCKIYRGGKDFVSSYFRIYFKLENNGNLKDVNVDQFADGP